MALITIDIKQALSSESVIDEWAQHPPRRFLADPCVDSLKRWTGLTAGEIPLEQTLHSMNDGGISHVLIAAWHGLQGALGLDDQVRSYFQAGNAARVFGITTP